MVVLDQAAAWMLGAINDNGRVKAFGANVGGGSGAKGAGPGETALYNGEEMMLPRSCSSVSWQ